MWNSKNDHADVPKGSWMRKQVTGGRMEWQEESSIEGLWRGFSVTHVQWAWNGQQWRSNSQTVVPGPCMENPLFQCPVGFVRNPQDKIGVDYINILMVVDEPSVVEAERLNFKNRDLRNCRQDNLNALNKLVHSSTNTKGWWISCGHV